MTRRSLLLAPLALVVFLAIYLGGRLFDDKTAEYRYDLCDLLPVELASTEGEGLLPLFQDLVRNPEDV